MVPMSNYCINNDKDIEDMFDCRDCNPCTIKNWHSILRYLIHLSNHINYIFYQYVFYFE